MEVELFHEVGRKDRRDNVIVTSRNVASAPENNENEKRNWTLASKQRRVVGKRQEDGKFQRQLLYVSFIC